MPEGRQRFELGYSPPGGLPGGHNPKLQVILRIVTSHAYQ